MLKPPHSLLAHSGRTRSIYFALGANLAVAIAKIVGWGLTGSGSMLAEGLHSIADTGNQGLLLLGLSQARKPPSVRHPLGQGRVIYFWSFIVALMLFSMGGLLSIYEGVDRLIAPVQLASPGIAIAILLFAALAEGISLRAAVHEINKVRGERSYWTWFKESRQSALLIVAAEDSAALAGLVFAFSAVLASALTGNPLYDALGSIAIGGLLIVVAITVSVQIKSLLVGESAAPEVRVAITRFLENSPEIIQIDSLITLQQGDQVIVLLKAEFRNEPSAIKLLTDMEQIKAAFLAAFPQVEMVYMEPVIHASQP
ncbi:MAG TPA: cation efflux family transporter [Betaproteobacteria bacterium]|nr:cation efflux family transporter [Betaproteobacteria bacterium]